MRPLEPPRYRIEHRAPDLPPLVLVATDSPATALQQLRWQWERLRAERERGAVVLVDQRDERDVSSWHLERTPAGH